MPKQILIIADLKRAKLMPLNEIIDRRAADTQLFGGLTETEKIIDL